MNPEDSISVFSNTDSFRILVAGGAGNIMAMFTGAAFHCWIMKKVELPANWDNLVKKYRDVVPTYVRY